MVVFTCNACGDSIKKAKVEQHYRTVCPNCQVLSCIDCGKDFYGDEYAKHDSCISEAEKYQGATYRPKDKANKGDQKQQSWLKAVAKSAASISDPKLKAAYDQLSGYSNIPRKEKKFVNFARNSLNIRDEAFLTRLWQHFGGAKASTAAVAATPPASVVVPQATATKATPTLIEQLSRRKRKGDDGPADKEAHATKKTKSEVDDEDVSAGKKKKSKKKSKKPDTKASTAGSSGSDESEILEKAKAWLKKKIRKMETAPSKEEEQAMLAKRVKKIRKQSVEASTIE